MRIRSVVKDRNCKYFSNDLDLIQLLSDDFEMFHFSEAIKDDSLNFDHTIKPGALRTTNAIKILEIEKFPKSIVKEAYKMTIVLKTKSFLDVSEKQKVGSLP